jgi:hypothetical protein
MRETKWRGLRQIRHVGAENPTVAHGFSYLLARIAGDYSDLGNSGGNELLQAVEQDRLICDWNKLLRAGCCQGSQSRSLAAGQNQALDACSNFDWSSLIHESKLPIRWLQLNIPIRVFRTSAYRSHAAHAWRIITKCPD